MQHGSHLFASELCYLKRRWSPDHHVELSSSWILARIPMEGKAQYCPAARMWFLPHVLLRRLVPNVNLNTAEPKKSCPSCSHCCLERTSSIYGNSWLNHLSEGQGRIKDEPWWLQWLDGWKRLCFYWSNCLHLLKKWGVFFMGAIEMDKLKCIMVLFILPDTASPSKLLLIIFPFFQVISFRMPFWNYFILPL